jgi:hypothetical protein
MRSLVVIAVALLAGPASAQYRRPGPTAVDAAIDRGLVFLKRDALAWKDEHHCVSCRHAALVVWSMREAKQLGHTVDEPFLAELTRWIAESGDGKTGLARPAGRPRALNAKAVWFALALGADQEPDATARSGLKRLLGTVKGDQTDDGSWSAWPETRPPIFADSDESMTALATLAVLPAAAAGDRSAQAVRDRGIRWLAGTKTDDDPQSVALRLVLWRRLGRPAEDWEPLARRIRERQNADGGWSQAKGMASDAWATGQALYALAPRRDETRRPGHRARPGLPDPDAARRRLLADDLAAGQARGRGVEEPDPDHRRRRRVGRPGAGAEPMNAVVSEPDRSASRWQIFLGDASNRAGPPCEG